MQINKNHVIAALTAVVIVDEVIAEVNRRRCNRNKKIVMEMVAINTYLSDKLDKAGVPMTDFDQIAIKSHIEAM